MARAVLLISTIFPVDRNVNDLTLQEAYLMMGLRKERRCKRLSAHAVAGVVVAVAANNGKGQGEEKEAGERFEAGCGCFSV
jgi:hypothetical protein